MSVSSHSRTYLDYSNEKSNLSFFVQQITGANLAATNALIGDIGVAIFDLTLGELAKTQTVLDFVISNPTPPTDPYAQRELKWFIAYRDVTTGRAYQLEIPCANLTGHLVAGTDQADLTNADWVAFVTAFEAGAKSQDGNAVEVLNAYVVGRNL